MKFNNFFPTLTKQRLPLCIGLKTFYKETFELLCKVFRLHGCQVSISVFCTFLHLQKSIIHVHTAYQLSEIGKQKLYQKFGLDLANFEAQNHFGCTLFSKGKIRKRLSRAPSSALLISRYILQLWQRRRCCFCAACSNRKMYLEIRGADGRLY